MALSVPECDSVEYSETTQIAIFVTYRMYELIWTITIDMRMHRGVLGIMARAMMHQEVAYGSSTHTQHIGTSTLKTTIRHEKRKENRTNISGILKEEISHGVEM